MAASITSRSIHPAEVGSDANFSFDAHERLALAMLAVQRGDGVADIEAAMRKIIESAPASTNVALVLSLALAHAGDRALAGEVLPGPSVRSEPSCIGIGADWQLRHAADTGAPGGQIVGRER